MARGGREHFAHAGTALRPFVADDDDVAFLDRAVEDGLERLFPRTSNTMALPLNCRPSLPVIFATAPSVARLPRRITKWLSFLIGLSKRLDDRLPGGIGFHAAQAFRAMVSPVTVRAVAVEQSFVEQHFHQRPDAADGDEFGHQMFAARFQVGEHGHAFADAGEIVKGQLHLRGMGDGEQVQHGIGRAAERDDHGDGVLKGLLGEDVERLDALAAASSPRRRRRARQSSSLAGEMAFCAELLGRLMPSASMALAMVLAVYMPPQEPAPGMAHCSTA